MNRRILLILGLGVGLSTLTFFVSRRMIEVNRVPTRAEMDAADQARGKVQSEAREQEELRWNDADAAATAGKPIAFAIVMGSQETWTPASEEVPLVIEEAKSFLEMIVLDPKADSYHQHCAKEILSVWHRYVCQVVGISEGGQDLIHFQFLGPQFRRYDMDWRSSYRAISDGGNSVWRLNFDPKTRAFSGFTPGGN